MAQQGDLDRWFDAGWAVFKGNTGDEWFPPLNDMEAQRWWLAGFGAAWVEYPITEAVQSMLFDDEPGGESIHDALAHALTGRSTLLAQLLSHRSGWTNRTYH